MKTLCFKNLLDDFWKHKIIVIALVLVFALSFGFSGYKKGLRSLDASPQNNNLYQEYEEALAEYDSNIANAENSLKLAEQQIEELQNYVDNSIYMKLDGQNLQIASSQYAVQSSDNIENVLSSIIYYVNEGGLKSDISEEYASLQPDYWREIISCTSSGNVLNITVMHYDSETAKEILSIVFEKIQKQIPAIEAVQGTFVLQEITTSYYTKSDVNVINNQNNYRNNLKNYINNRIDQNNKVISQKNAKSTYIEKNKDNHVPVVLNPVITAVKFAFVGIVFGIALPGIWFILKYLLGNRIHSARDIENIGLKVLATYKAGKENALFNRSIVNIEYLSKLAGTSSVFLYALQNDKETQMCLNEYKSFLEKEDLQIFSGSHLNNDMNELKSLIACKNTILFIHAGTALYTDLERMIQTCKNFDITISGCIVLE